MTIYPQTLPQFFKARKFKTMQKDISKILFFDIEVVRNVKELDGNSKEFKLYQHKIRNKEIDELPDFLETKAHYEKFAGLKAIYHKIVCISVCAVKDGKAYCKSYTGGEKEIIENFYKKTQEYDYICGYNCMSYDLPLTRICALRYPEILVELPDRFEDTGIRDLKNKKPWNLDRILDLMDFLRGGHWSNISLSEAAYHLGLSDSKDDIDGSKVSEVYYNEGVERISTYCKKDVFSTLQLFCKLSGREMFNEFVDIDKMKEAKEFDKPIPLLEKILAVGKIDKLAAEQIKEIASKLTPEEKEKALVVVTCALGTSKKKVDKTVIELFK